ncbi:MAG: diacylglycerol kinase family lipid kinase [Anaerolineae bacterium]|nr:diacylglycerol kinase family lipid kinase [Anaerolineae bacterium]
MAETAPLAYKVIVNPLSGRGNGARSKGPVRRALDIAGVRYEMVETRGPGHAVELARQAVLDGWDVVVSVGGDGTAHEALQGLVQAAQLTGAWQSGRPIGTLGLIPIGTGNDYAWRLGLPQGDPEAACRVLLQDHRAVVDVGQVTDEAGRSEFFLNHLGAGFEAATLIESLKLRRLRGFLLYLSAVLRVIPRYSRGWEMAVHQNGTAPQTRPLILASVANGGRTGGGFMMAPDARLDDGELDLVCGHTPNPAVTLWLLPHVIRGTHLSKKRYVSASRAAELVLEAPAGVPVHLDGEVFRTDARRLEIRTLPGRLRVVAAAPAE